MTWVRTLSVPFAALALVIGCSNTVDLFNPNGGGGGGGGATGSGGASSNGSNGVGTSTGSSQSSVVVGVGGATQSSVGVGGATVTTSVGVGGATVATSVGVGGMGTGGAGGGGGMCAHPICNQGMPLMNGCDACVSQICAADMYCCNTFWDATCVAEVDTICNVSCFPTNMGPCGMQYPNKPVCSDANDQCQLAHNSQQSSCATLCGSGGGECLGAFNDVNNQVCQVDQGAPYTCNGQQFASLICVCSQGCGNGPACMAPQICQNGQCI